MPNKAKKHPDLFPPLVVLYIRVSQDMAERVKAQAALDQRSVTSVVRIAIGAYLEKQEVPMKR
jgi:predicted transcriptional regulator